MRFFGPFKDWKFLLKLAVVAGLLLVLSKKGFLSLEATREALARLDLVVPGLLLQFVNAVLTAVRWGILLRAQNVRLPWMRVFELQFVGNFFNVALPGAVSGDVVKAYYVGREAPGARAVALSSILMDRVVGVTVLLGISVVTLGIAHFGAAPWVHNLEAALTAFIILCGAMIALFYTVLFWVSEKRDPFLRILAALEKGALAKPVSSLLRIYRGMRHYGKTGGTRGARAGRSMQSAMLLSVVVHLLSFGSFYFFGRAYGEQIPLLALGIVVPLGLLVTAIPITPAGVGTGHAAFLWLFALLGSQRGADIFSLFVLATLLQSALGGLIYLRFKSKAPLELQPSVDFQHR